GSQQLRGLRATARWNRLQLVKARGLPTPTEYNDGALFDGGPARARCPLFLNRTRSRMNLMNLPTRGSLWNWLPAIVALAAVTSLSAAPPTGRADDDRIASQLAEIEPID